MELGLALCALICALAIGQSMAENIAGVDGVSTKANEFFIGFIQSSTLQLEPQGSALLITTDELGTVRFTVEVDNPLLSLSAIARYGEVTTLPLPAEVGVVNESLSERNKGVRIRAEGEKRISVYGTSSGERATGSFTALPCVDYPFVPRQSYLVFSIPGALQSDILIVGCSNDTSVDMTPTASLTIPSDLNPSASPLNAGEPASFTMQQLQTVFLQSSDDLSGTLITADKPIAVFTGQRCGHFPQECDYIIEQVPPHPTWGKTFFTVGVADGGLIFASIEEGETVVNITCTMEGDNSPPDITETVVVNATEVYNFTTVFDGFCCIEASQPILLLQYGIGSDLDMESSSGDLFLVTIPSLEQYSNNFTVSTPDANVSSILSIVVPVQHFDNSPAARSMIRVNGSTASENWQEIYCSGGDVCAYGTLVTLGDGASTVFHEDPSAGVAAVVYGSSGQGAFGYSAGSSLNPILFPIVSLSSSELSVSEGDGTVTLTVTRQGDIGRAIEVELETTSLNATVGEDFANATQTLQFLPGEREKEVTIEILDELLLEIEESFLVSISVAEEMVVVLLDETEITIIDDDIFRVGFDSPSYTTNEGTGRVSLVIRSNIPNVGIPPIILQFSTVAGSGTATAGEDYLPLETVVLFDTGSREEIINLDVIDDDTVEGETEVFQVQLEVVAPLSGVVLLQANASIFIEDINNVTVFLEPTSVDVREDGGNVTLTVVKSGETLVPTTILITTANETATAGEDYVPLSFFLSLAPSQSNATITVSILPDGSLEDDETLVVVMTAPPGERIRFLPSRSRATVIIRNDDEVYVQFERERYFVSEGQGTANLTVIKNGTNSIPFSVIFSTQPSDATAPQDYLSLTQSVFFAPSTTFQVVGVTITTDDIVESPERFLASLSLPSGSIGVTIRQPQTAEVIISDDDAVAVGFAPVNYTVLEGATNVSLRIMKVGISVRDISVQFSTEDGSATDSDDYVRANQVLTFGPGGDEVQEVGVAIQDNAQLEAAEIFFGRLVTRSGGVLITGGESAQVEVLDDDEVVVGFSQLSYTVNEGEGSVTLRLAKEGMAAIPVAVQYFAEPDTADDMDFNLPAPVTAIIGPRQTSLEVQVLIVNDGIIETTEEFRVRLQVAVGQDGVVLVNDTATVTILDSDMVIVTFDPLQYNVMENAGIAGIRLVKSGEATTNVTVIFSTVEQEATAPQDYNETQLEVTFTPSQVEQFVSVVIKDDDTYEATESFFGVLSPGPEGGVIALPVVASVLIEDNDAVTIGFNSTMAVVREADGNVSLTLTKDGSNDVPLSVDISFQEGTASAPGDFVLLSRRVEFRPEDEDRPVVVRLQRDDVLENTESFSVGIVQPGGGMGVMIASGRGSVTIQIRDSTPGLEIGFDVVEFEVGEGAGFAEFRLVLFGTLERSINVSFTTLDGTAVAGEDYNATVRDIVFRAGVEEELVRVPVRDDSVREEGEMFSALISSSDSDVIFRQDSATVSIIDDDGIFVTFDPVAYTVEEGVGEVVLSVRREGESEGDVSVTFNTRDESALGNIILVDYVPVMETVVFSAGVTEVNITIEILDDDSVEPQERFFAMLAIPPGVGGITLGQDEASVTIIDDDVVFIGFSHPLFIAPEGEPTVFLSLERRGQSQTLVTVEFFTADDSATAPMDYRSTTQEVVFGPQATQETVVVTVFDDVLVEGTEKFLGMLRVPLGVTGVVLVNDTTTVEVLDNDFATVSFAQPVFIALERDGSVSISLTKEGNTVIAVNVIVRTVANCTATVGADYEALDKVVTFLSNETSVTVAIAVSADGLVEIIEDFQLVLLSGDETIVGLGAATVRIVDEDEVAVGLEQVTYTVMETQGIVEVCARIMEGQLQRSVVVTLSTAIEDEGFFGAGPGDFTPLTADLVLDSITTRLCFNISIEDDSVYELDEFITILLSTDDLAVQLDPESADVVIADNEMIVVAFELPSYTVSEGDESVEVCVVVVQGLLGETAFSFFYSLSEDTATEPADFIEPSSLTFPALGPGDSSRQCLVVRINEDPLLEENSEQFTIKLLNSVLYRGTIFNPDLPRSTIGLNTTTIFIADNDAVTIGFVMEFYEVTEGQQSDVEICTLLSSGQLEREAVVRLATLDVSARAPFDYAATTVDLTFNPSNFRRCVNIIIEDDNRIEEETEVFNVSLTTSDLAIDLDPFIAAIRVRDNDGVFGFEEDAYNTIESAGSLEVCVTARDGVLEAQFQFALRTTSGSASGEEDYVEIRSPTFETLTLDQLNPRSCANITILDDQIQEGIEDFTVLLFRITNGDIQEPNFSEATVTILDNDVVTVGFNSSIYEVEEGSETATVCLVRGGETNQPFNVTVIHEMESFEMTEIVLQFSLAVPFVCFSLALDGVDDDLALEPPETTSLRLSLPPGILPGAIEAAAVLLVDDDSVTIEFFTSRYDVMEDSGDVTVCLIKDRRTAQDFSVTVAASNAPECKYCITSRVVTVAASNAPESFSGVVTFNPTASNSCIVVPISDNEVALQDDRELRLVIVPPTDLPAVLLGARQEAVIVVGDNDVVTVELSADSYEVQEDNGTVTVCLGKDRTTAVAIPATLLPRQLLPPSARETEDFSSDPIPVLIPTQTSMMCIGVPVHNDRLFEGPQQFAVAFSLSLPDPRLQLGPTAEASVTIIDDDIVMVTGDDVTVPEEAGTVMVCFNLSLPSEGPLHLPLSFTVSDIPSLPAEAGLDYNAPVQMVTFLPGELRACVSIEIISEDLVEGDEQFCVDVMSSDPGIQAPEPCSVTVTILDAGPPPPGLCTVEDSIIVSPFQARRLEQDQDFSFHGTCEHILVTNCNFDPVHFTVTVDFLSSNLDMGRVGIQLKERRIIIKENLSLELINLGDPVSSNETATEYLDGIVVIREVNQTTVYLRNLDIQIYRLRDGDENALVVNASRLGSPVREVCGLCGTLDGELLFSDRSTTASILDRSQVDRFADSWRVNPGEQFLREQRRECGFLDDDLVVGDPLFTVPLYDQNGTSSGMPSLCYEIHGSTDRAFSLVSDRCTSVNALYSALSIPDNGNIISAIGVRAVNKLGRCIDIRVDLNNSCMPIIVDGNATVTTPRYQSDGVSVDKHGRRVRISVPNCENVQLVMWIVCEEVRGEGMLRFIITRGVNLRPTSHGLLGQFWNVPISFEPYQYTGRNPDIAQYFRLDRLYVISVQPPSGQTRRFVGELYHRTWDKTLEPCYYAGTSQGGAIREFANSPRDTVIEGRYRQYQVQGLFETEFTYSRFNSNICL